MSTYPRRFMFGLLVSLCVCGRTHAGEVTVRIANPPATGTVVALLFDSADAFIGLRYPTFTQPITGDSNTVARFENLPAGEYAVAVFHDVNTNGRLDQNFIGIPNEPLGFSRSYWPKGPPTFSRAAFLLDEGETNGVAVELKSVFGKRGLIGVGVGVVGQTPPYKDYEGTVAQVIPAISYTGERLQFLGPSVMFGVFAWSHVSIAVSATYRLGAYEEDKSPILEGLGDRDSTVNAGAVLRVELPAGVDFSAGYEYDLLGKTDGGIGKLKLDRSFQFKNLTLAPSIGVNHFDSGLVAYEYGVPANKANEDRAAYDPGAALNPELGLGVMVDLGKDWRIFANGAVEFSSPEILDSPLVEAGEVFSLFCAVMRLF